MYLHVMVVVLVLDTQVLTYFVVKIFRAELHDLPARNFDWEEFFEGILYHHKRNHKQLSKSVGVWGRSSWKICLAFKVP